ncbi:MAG: class I SAM-dependent methyltransferase [Actinomycetota bacterium]|nr:class I SAM-dependent methyltransferase [Actinomycetota bacterium]
MVDRWSKPLTVEEMYGEWDYEAAVEVLERSLNPRRGASIFDTVESLGIGADDAVLDIGGRDAFHGLLIAERFGCRVVSVDPAPANIEAGIKAVAKHEYGHLVEVRLGAIEQIPAEDGQFDLVFSRDMMGHVADIEAGLAECSRVLVPGGLMLVHAVFDTELMEPIESERLCRETATVPERTTSTRFEEDVRRAGFIIESLDMVGSEWYEANQEAGTSPNYALQISRLRRAGTSFSTSSENSPTGRCTQTPSMACTS